MNASRRIIALAAVLACAVPASAQTVTLRHKFVVNELTQYHMQVSGRGTVGVSGLPGSGQMAVPLQMTMVMDTRQRVIAVSPQGVATLRNVIDGMTLNATMTVEGKPMVMEMQMSQKGMRMKVNGKEMAQPPEVAREMKKMNVFGKPFLSKMDARGRILEMKLPGMDMLKQMMPGFDLSTLYQSGQSTQFILPEKPVSVGQTWQDTIKMPIPGLPRPIEMQVISQLLGVERGAAGRTIARIQQTVTVNADNLAFNYKIPGQTEQGVSFAFDRLRQMITGPVLWAVDEGKLVRMDMDMSQDIAMSMAMPMPTQQGGVQTGQVQMFMAFQMKASMVRK